ncbi:hypothetical protein BDR06DRAFT_1012431 [Suillus hirtellus]|nr:hypothetical protein BDR06DRAFT_1012431 [Suillus hirtellus]
MAPYSILSDSRFSRILLRPTPSSSIHPWHSSSLRQSLSLQQPLYCPCYFAPRFPPLTRTNLPALKVAEASYLSSSLVAIYKKAGAATLSTTDASAIYISRLAANLSTPAPVSSVATSIATSLSQPVFPPPVQPVLPPSQTT